MAATYTYYKTVDSIQLIGEIITAGLPEPVVNRSGTEVRIVFDSTLTTGQVSALTTVVTNHSPRTIEEGVLLEELSDSLKQAIQTPVYPYYKYVESGISSFPLSTSSTTYGSALGLTTDDLELGLYRIGWFYNWNADTTKENFMGRVTLNDGAIAYHEQEPADSAGNYAWTYSDQQHVHCGFHTATLSGVNKIAIQYMSPKSKTYVSIWNMKIEVMRVG